MSTEFDIPTPRTNVARGFDTVVGAEEMAKLERELAVITLERDEAKFERETVEAESQQLRKQIDGNIEDYLNEKLCCNGHECGCGGVTRLQQYVMEEVATELGSLRAELTEAKERIASLKESFEFAREKRDAAEQQVMALRGAFVPRIQSYLGNGGVFNPEFMDHNAVRDLLIDIRDALAASPAPTPAAPIMPPGWDNIPLNHPRRIAQIAYSGESLSHESVEVQRLCVEYREAHAARATSEIKS